MFKNKLVKIFYCCSDFAKDEEMRQQLEEHLRILQRDRIIEGWHSGMISPGKECKRETYNNLKNADIILLLISVKFTTSDYHWDDLTKQAIEQYRKKISRVIIIKLRPVDDYWMKDMFPEIKVLPDDGRPITEWKPYDRAFKNIAEGIRKEVEELSDPIYHIKKYLPQARVATIRMVLLIGNSFIHLGSEIFSYFVNLSNTPRYPRYRRSRKIPLGLFIGILVVTVPFLSQLSNISQLLSSDISEISRSEPRTVLTKTQRLRSTGWIPIGKIDKTSSLNPEESLLEAWIDPPVVPSIKAVVTVKSEIDLKKEQSPSSEILQKLELGDKLDILQLKPTNPSQDSKYIEVWAQVRKL